MRVNRMAGVLAVALVAGVLASGAAVAGKPSGGGGTGGGTIYFWAATSQLWSMNSDGTGKTSLAVTSNSVPSRLTHGGHHWFLQARDIAGQSYPPGQDGIGGTRREIFAVRDDNASALQLTTQADLETDGQCEWMPGDAAVSWDARRWSNGVVADGGVYTATVNFDGNGDVTGLGTQPATPAIPISLVLWNTSPRNYPFGGDLGPDIYTHDWSPGGTQIVFDRFSANDVWIADLAGGSRPVVASWARVPVWSPDGSRIAYYSGSGRGSINTISPVGAGDSVIVRAGTSYSVDLPTWSPTGSHLVFERFENSLQQYVYRVAASGGTTTNLTPGTTHAAPVAWR